MNIKIWGQGPENNDPIPKIIWTFWDAHLESSLVDLCFEQIRNLLPDYKLNIITRKNVGTFLGHDIMQPRTDISFVNFTDLVRLKLLNKYGGYWIDASVFITQKFDWISDLRKKYSPDIIGFFSDFFTSDYNFPLLETWFIASTPNNLFIETWCKEFEKCYISENPHEYFNIEKKNIFFLQKIDNDLSNYLIAYLAASKIMRQNDNFRLLIMPSSESAHFYNFNLKLKPHQLAEEFLLKKEAICDLPLVKFERRGREAIDDYINKGLMSENSLLFKLLSNPSKKYSSLKYKLKYFRYIGKNLLKKLIATK